MPTANNFHPAPTAGGAQCNVPYTEPAYAILLGNAANPRQNGTYFNFRIPFCQFAGTTLSYDEDTYFGDGIQIQFVMEDPNKWIWTGLDATNPSLTPTALVAAQLAGLAFNNMNLYAAVQKDPEIVARARARYEKGYKCYIPHIQKVYQYALSGTAQQPQVTTIGPGLGERLLTIMAAPFAGTENLNTSLDHANSNPTTADATGLRVMTFQTQWDQDVRQQNYISASPQYQGGTTAANMGSIGDWDRYREQIQGSCIQCSGQLGLNWCYYEDFTDPSNKLKKSFGSNYIDGVYIRDGGHQWIMQTTNGANYLPAGNINWYVFAHTLKVMEIGPGVLTIS